MISKLVEWGRNYIFLLLIPNFFARPDLKINKIHLLCFKIINNLDKNRTNWIRKVGKINYVLDNMNMVIISSCPWLEKTSTLFSLTYAVGWWWWPRLLLSVLHTCQHIQSFNFFNVWHTFLVQLLVFLWYRVGTEVDLL